MDKTMPAVGDVIAVDCPVCDGLGVFTATQSKCRSCDGGTFDATVVEYDGGPVWDQLTEAHKDLSDWVDSHYREGVIHPVVAVGDVRYVHPCRVGPPPMPFSVDSLMDSIIDHWSTEAEEYEAPPGLEEHVLSFCNSVNAYRQHASDMWFPIDDQVIAHQFKAKS